MAIANPILKLPSETVEGYFQRLRNDNIYEVPSSIQGITKSQISNFLDRIGIPQICSGPIFALLDSDFPSVFPNSIPLRFSDGASTSHLACYIGILGNRSSKLDREGRDYWIRPLREINAIDLVTYDSRSRSFLDGHTTAKSPHCAYRLSDPFKSFMLRLGKELLGVINISWPFSANNLTPMAENAA